MKNRHIDQQPRNIAIAIELDHIYPWHHECYQGILRYAEQYGWTCVVDPYLVGATGGSDITDYQGVVGRINQDVSEMAKSQGLPVVNLWTDSPAHDPSVLIDYASSTRLAADHLITCGYRRLAYIGNVHSKSNRMEQSGLEAIVRDRGLSTPDIVLCENDFERSRDKIVRFRRQLTNLLQKLPRPAGIFVYKSSVARYLAQVCREMKLDVPGDVGIVVQFGDTSSEAAWPGITSIEHDFVEQGYQAAALLDELLQGKQVHPQHRLLSPKRLIVRDSTDVFLCEDELVRDAMRYIAEHIRQELRVEDLAQAMDVSARTLRRRFESVLGRSIKSEIARLRSDQIKLLLTETDKPLSEIAEEFGFSSPGQFTRFFTTAEGTTPSDYRKAHRRREEAE